MAVSLGVEAVRADAAGSLQDLAAQQRARYGFDQGDASAVLLGHWGFPAMLAQAVRFRPLPAEPDGNRECSLPNAWR